MIFMVRIWADETTGAPAWRGEAEQIGTGQLWTFATMDELAGWMRLILNPWEETRHARSVQGGSAYEENYGDSTNG